MADDDDDNDDGAVNAARDDTEQAPQKGEAGRSSLVRIGEGHPLMARLTPDAQHLLNFAAWIGAHQEDVLGQVSFLSPFIALLARRDRLARTLRRGAGSAVLDPAEVSGIPAVRLAEWERVSLTKLPQTDKPPFTSSGEGLLRAAATLADELSPRSRRIDTRHIVAAYLYTHPSEGDTRRSRPHEGELRSRQVNLERASRGLIALVDENYPEEFDAWRARHQEDFGVLLPATTAARIVRDYWTAEDTLGYAAYARAIAFFLTHKQTREPLCVGIQAPWGAGKTSLMRMIQKRLDPEAMVIAEARGGTRPADNTTGATTAEVLKVLAGAMVNVAAPTNINPNQRRTVWFNAWKYQSTDQLWAGLVDAIITQISDRMSPAERELFLVRLNAARIDREVVRRRVYERILSLTWATLRDWARWLTGGVAASAAVAAGGAVAGGVTGVTATAVASAGAVAVVTLAVAEANKKAKQKVDKEPATVSLADLLRVPNYAATAGFVHAAAADLERVLATVPKENLPLVIFIDDLDRCAPDKVASVVEGVNLFLAGEFPNCLFVIGMDPQVVSAALDEAQAKIVQHLPAYDRSTALGWRFMDKFVQLPFTIPPVDDADLEHFSEAMLVKSEALKEVSSLAELAAEDELLERTSGSPAVRKLVAMRRASQEQEARQKRYAERYDDERDDARRTLNNIATKFSRNPREIKRLTNVVRLFSMLRFAREDRGLDVPGERQYEDWVVLSLKWPDFVRWLCWAGGGGDPATPNSRDQIRKQLTLLENAARDIPDFVKWQEAVATHVGHPVTGVPWLVYPELHRFLARQAGYAEGERLSTAAGIGFY